MVVLSNKCISILLFSTLILYKIIGVTIHDQYGFGLYYWTLQLLVLLMLSFIYLFKNSREIKYIFKYNLLPYHMYIWILLLFQSVYIVAIPDSSYLKFGQQLSIFFETLAWYIVSLVLILNFSRIILLMKLNIILLFYVIVLFFFFLFLFHINSNLILGITFPYAMKDILPGYSWGFHLFFSPYFAFFSFSIIVILRNNKEYFQSYLISIISLYVLLLAGGRGTLFSFAFILFLFFFSKKVKLIVMIFIVLVFLGGNNILKLFSDNARMYNLITFQLEDDGSGTGRARIFEQNWTIVKDNYVFGSINNYFDGAYIHNILSILQDYGIFVFLMMILIIIHGSYIFSFKTKQFKNNIALQIAKLIFFFSITDHILFKYSSPLIEVLPILIMYGYTLLFLKSKYFRSKFN